MNVWSRVLPTCSQNSKYSPTRTAATSLHWYLSEKRFLKRLTSIIEGSKKFSERGRSMISVELKAHFT